MRRTEAIGGMPIRGVPSRRSNADRVHHMKHGGFATTLQPGNLVFCFLGVFVGMLVGVLPGIGPLAALSLLLPLT